MAKPEREIDPFKVSSPRIYLFRMLVFLVLGVLLVVVLHRQIWTAFLANPGLNGLIVGVLLIGVVLFAVLLMGFGTSQATTTLASVNECVISGSQAAAGQTECTDADPAAPAHEAGLLPGDKITGFDGKQVSDWTELSELIREAAGRSVTVTYERGGVEAEATITPLLTERPVTAEDGTPQLDADGNAVTQEVGFIGVGSQTALVRQPATRSSPGGRGRSRSGSRTWRRPPSLPRNAIPTGP